jgi:hypothetical protein
MNLNESEINSILSIREQIQDDLICLLDSQFGEVEYVDTYNWSGF